MNYDTVTPEYFSAHMDEVLGSIRTSRDKVTVKADDGEYVVRRKNKTRPKAWYEDPKIKAELDTEIAAFKRGDTVYIDQDKLDQMEATALAQINKQSRINAHSATTTV